MSTYRAANSASRFRIFSADTSISARIVLKVAAAALLARYWPKAGEGRHYAMLALAGFAPNQMFGFPVVGPRASKHVSTISLLRRTIPLATSCGHYLAIEARIKVNHAGVSAGLTPSLYCS